MGLDAIDSSGLRGYEALRITTVTPAARQAADRDVPEPVKPVETARADRPAASGVPRRIGVPQQLPPNTRLHIDKESNRVVAQVLDENNEVIRQIPPEALLELSTRLNRLEGLLFNQEL